MMNYIIIKNKKTKSGIQIDFIRLYQLIPIDTTSPLSKKTFKLPHPEPSPLNLRPHLISHHRLLFN